MTIILCIKHLFHVKKYVQYKSINMFQIGSVDFLVRIIELFGITRYLTAKGIITESLKSIVISNMPRLTKGPNCLVWTNGTTLIFKTVKITETSFNYGLFQYVIDVGSSLWLGLSVLGLYDMGEPAFELLNINFSFHYNSMYHIEIYILKEKISKF